MGEACEVGQTTTRLTGFPDKRIPILLVHFSLIREGGRREPGDGPKADSVNWEECPLTAQGSDTTPWKAKEADIY